MRIIVICTLLLFCALSATMFFVYHNRESHSPSYDVTLPMLIGPAQEFDTKKIKKSGRAFVINVFSSWCTACLEEHTTWRSIAETAGIDIYGIAYIDVEHSTLSWLQKHGNPYKMVAADYTGKTAKTFGVLGVPETFVFNKNGILVSHIAGVVTAELWERRISGLVKR